MEIGVGVCEARTSIHRVIFFSLCKDVKDILEKSQTESPLFKFISTSLHIPFFPNILEVHKELV